MSELIYKKDFSSDPELLPEIEQYVVSIADEINLNKDKYNNLELAVAEIASNSMVHGNSLDKDKKVKITVRVDKKKMVLSFKDEGRGFDPSLVPDPTSSENLLKESGRGIHIIKNFVDDLTFNFTPNGTEAILTLKLD